jgi:hypothetical protein
VPVTVTANVADCGAVTLWSEGCAVTRGAVASGLTLSSTELVVTLPDELVTTARRRWPFWATVTGPAL